MNLIFEIQIFKETSILKVGVPGSSQQCQAASAFRMHSQPDARSPPSPAGPRRTCRRPTPSAVHSGHFQLEGEGGVFFVGEVRPLLGGGGRRIWRGGFFCGRMDDDGEREEDEEATSGASSHIVCADGNNVEETFSFISGLALCV